MLHCVSRHTEGGRGPQGRSFLTHVGGICDLGSAVPLLRWGGSRQ